jgi:hypothetical protein
VSSIKNAPTDLLKRAQDARKSAEAIDDAWMKELLEHVAQEYERAAERATILAREEVSENPAPGPSKTSLFAI